MDTFRCLAFKHPNQPASLCRNTPWADAMHVQVCRPLSFLLHTSGRTSSISPFSAVTTSQVDLPAASPQAAGQAQHDGPQSQDRAGECWPAVRGGGPAGSLPPHSFCVYFSNGGVGTFLPLYFSSIEAARQAGHQQSAQASMPQNIATALVDPSDPTKLYLTQPAVPQEQPLPSAPVYAANYGEDETYESLGG